MSQTPKCPLCDSEMQNYGDVDECHNAACALYGFYFEPAQVALIRDQIAAKLAPQPSGEGVEVRAAVGRYPDGSLVIYGHSQELELSKYLRRYFGGSVEQIAWITARVPMPIVPTVRGTVEQIGGDREAT